MTSVYKHSRRTAANDRGQTQNSVRRIGSALRVTSHGHPAQEMTQQDVVTAGELLENQWESLNEKLTLFLNRNGAGYGPEFVSFRTFYFLCHFWRLSTSDITILY